MAWPFRSPVNTEDSPDESSNWEPPDYASPVKESDDKEWKPPSYASAVQKKDEEPSTLKKAWNWASKPLTEAPTEFAKKVSHYINPESQTKGIRGVGSAYIEGLGEAVSGLTSPLNLAFAGAGAGEAATAKALPKVAQALRTGSRVLSAPVVAEGAKNIYKGVKDVDLPETLSGVLEAGTGALGLRGEAPKGEPPIRQSREIPYRMEEPTKPINAVQDFMKKNPDAKMADVKNFIDSIKNVTPASQEEAKPEEVKQPFVSPFDKPKESTLPAHHALLSDEALAKLQEEKPKPEESVASQSVKDVLDKFNKSIMDEIGNRPPGTGYNYETGKIEPLKPRGEWKAPDYAQLAEEGPSFARSEQGGIKIGQNIKRSAQELTTGYSNPLEGVMVREGMQNAIDAVRHLDENGKLGVKIDTDGMTISDNGKGMTREELETVFSNLHESGKTTEAGATGGKGIGKATYILGGKKFRAETVVFEGGQKVKRIIEGTPDEFSEHVPIKEEVVPLNTPTGTTIRTDFKPGQDSFNAKEMLSNIQQYSRGIKSKMSISRYGKDEPVPFADEKADKIIGRQNIEGHDVTIRVPSDEPLKTRGLTKVKFANNGMYQFEKYHHFRQDTDHMPENIIVDIHPTAEEGTTEYPFPTQRESLKDSMRDKIENMIDEKLAFPEQQGKKVKLRELYASMQQFKGSNTVRKSVLFDPGKRLTPEEAKTFSESPVMNAFIENVDRTIDNILKTTNEPKWTERLEGVGIVLDPNMHGVHIPNPDTGKSTILINPFEHIASSDPKTASLETSITALHESAHIGTEIPVTYKQVTAEELKDSRVGTYLQSYLTQVMTHGGLDQGHGIGFIKRLAQVYSDYGPRRTFEEADNLEKILTDNTGGYNSEVQRLLQIYKESRGRTATTEDLLSGTGNKQESSTGGKGNIPPGDKPDGEGAVNKLFEALDEARGRNQEQQAINKAERARRFAAFAGVKQEGAAGAAKSLGKLRGEYEKVDPGEALGLSPKDTDTLFTSIKRARITEGEKARGYTALFKLLNGETTPVRSELKILDDVFGNGFGDKIVEMHGGIGAVGLKVSKLANTMKSMQNAISLAAPLRHGIGLVTRKEFYPAFADMFKFFGNKEFYNASMKAIQERPNYLLGRESDLFLSSPGSMQNAEEEFLNSYIGKVPIIREAVGASQRAYTGFLNKLRADTFDSMIKQAEGLGYKSHTMVKDQIVPSDTTNAISRYINNATGRGSLGSLNKITNELNIALWSPRMIASRITMLTNPKIYMDLPKGMRLDGLKSLLGIAALGTAIDTLAAYGGAKVSTNILSSDYGKSRFGTKLIDPWGGFQQYIVGGARFLAGKTDSPQPTNRLNIAGRFLANKESPAASLAHMILTSKPTRGGQPGDITTEYGQKTSIEREVANRFTPIFVQDIMDLMSTQPDWSENVGLTAAMTGASLAGMAQDYPAPQQKGKLQIRRPRLQ